MNIVKIDHIGVAVDGIEEAGQFWQQILGLAVTESETVESQQVTTGFIPVGDSEIELLESTMETGPIAKFIEKRGPGIHHIAFEVDNLAQALEELKSAGIRLIDEQPRPGAGDKRIAFLHPKATGGVLVELCERVDRCR
ncbi:MAG: methylmalonyl-CoA epimerase [Spirochaetales bacterium]|nr:methylmalonyl-CoA epimerase [Spirochaetales bacterium]